MLARTAVVLIIALLGTLAVGDILARSHAALFEPDEIKNCDAVSRFLTEGNYTTSSLGAYPFNPMVSSGILAMGVQGVVLVAGGTLHQARVAALTSILIAFTLLTAWMFRAMSLPPTAGVATGLFVWLAFLVYPDILVRAPAEPRGIFILPAHLGELWGIVWLGVGLALSSRRPLLAAAFFGAAGFLCKAIFLPFGAALALVNGWYTRPAVDHSRRDSLRHARLHAVAFVASLLLWLGLIAIRFGPLTAIGWFGSYVDFVVTHTVGHPLPWLPLPVLAGWRFAPAFSQGNFMEHGVAVPLLAVVGAGLAVYSANLLLLAMRRVECGPRERALAATVAAVCAALTIWFLVGDPTQWARHLMPAIYGAIALGTYCVVHLASQLVAPGRLRLVLPTVIALAFVGLAAPAMRASTADLQGRLSYARLCRHPSLLSPPCMQAQAERDLLQIARRHCDAQSLFDGCIIDNRQRIMAEATQWPQPAWTRGYMAIVMQHFAYAPSDDPAAFFSDARSVVCDEPVRRQLEDAGLRPEDCQPIPSGT